MPGKKKLHRGYMHVRVDKQSPPALKEIAFKFGLLFDGEGSIGKLMDAIAAGEIQCVHKEEYFD